MSSFPFNSISYIRATEGLLSGMHESTVVGPTKPRACPDVNAILDVVYVVDKRLEFNVLVVDFLERQFQKSTASIKDLKASREYLFGSHADWWISVEWKQEPGLEAIAIVKGDRPRTPCSGLVLVRNQEKRARPIGKEFEGSSLEWTVSSMEELKELFLVLQKKLGIELGQRSDMFKITLEGNPKNLTEQQYVSVARKALLTLPKRIEMYVKVLISVHFQFPSVLPDFEGISPLLKRFSTKERIKSTELAFANESIHWTRDRIGNAARFR